MEENELFSEEEINQLRDRLTDYATRLRRKQMTFHYLVYTILVFLAAILFINNITNLIIFDIVCFVGLQLIQKQKNKEVIDILMSKIAEAKSYREANPESTVEDIINSIIDNDI